MRQSVVIAIGCALAWPAFAQFGRGSSDWNTAGFDAQRSAWVRTDSKINKDSVAKGGFTITWKIALKDAKAGELGPPILLNRYIGYRGFRSFAWIGGAGDNLYAVDTDLSRLEWHDHLGATAGMPAGCAAPAIPILARPSATAFPAAPQGRGGGGGGRGGPAKGTVGQPGEGAANLAQLATTANMAPGAGRGGGGGGRGPTFDMNAMNASRKMQNSVYALTSDGMLHGVWLSSGAKSDEAMKFLAPGAGARGLMVVDSVAYAATSAGCGGSSGISALNLATKEVTGWNPKGAVAGAEGFAVGPDGTLYAASSGASPSVAALEAKTLAQKDWYASNDGDLLSSPVIFEFKDRALLAVASKNKKIVLLDTKSLGGADHQTALGSAAVEAAPESLATWQDAAGTRWLLGNTEGAIRAWKVVDRNGSPALETAWVSPEIAAPVAPMIVNGVVFAASRGNRSGAAVLYALDPSTGKELWNSGKMVTSAVAASGIAAGENQIYLGTADGTLYAFGFPIEH